MILDVVYNHVGPSGNYLSEFGPYFTDRYATPWGPLVNFDGPGSDGVRAFVIENTLMWLRDYHVDGLRLDAVDAIDDRSATNVLEELVDKVERLGAHAGRPLWVTAENDQHDPVLVRSRDANGYGLHAQWNDDFHHAVHVALTGERTGYYVDFDAADIAAALENGFVLAGRSSTYRGRTHGRSLGDVPFWRLVAFVQNHDQIGNRARGDRLSHLVPPGGAKVAAALLLTAPFVPLLFQGEEWAASTPFLYFVDHDDPEFAGAVRQGRQREFAAFGWDPDDIPDPNAEATFRASQLDWSELDEGEHREVLDFYRSLIRLRRERFELTDGLPAEVVGDPASGVIQARRGALAIVVNLTKDGVRCRRPLGNPPAGIRPRRRAARRPPPPTARTRSPSSTCPPRSPKLDAIGPRVHRPIASRTRSSGRGGARGRRGRPKHSLRASAVSTSSMAAGVEDAPTLQQQDVRVRRRDLVDVVGHQHCRRRARVGGELRQPGDQVLAPTEVETGVGLVEQQEAGVGEQRAGELHPLAFAG